MYNCLDYTTWRLPRRWSIPSSPWLLLWTARPRYLKRTCFWVDADRSNVFRFSISPSNVFRFSISPYVMFLPCYLQHRLPAFLRYPFLRHSFFNCLPLFLLFIYIFFVLSFHTFPFLCLRSYVPHSTRDSLTLKCQVSQLFSCYQCVPFNFAVQKPWCTRCNFFLT